MSILAILSPDGALDRDHLIRQNNLNLGGSAELEIDVEIPGLPTQNYMSAPFGFSSGGARISSYDLPPAGEQMGLEFHATVVVPFNTDFSTANTTSDILIITGFGMTVQTRVQADGSISSRIGTVSAPWVNPDGSPFEFEPGFLYHMVYRMVGSSTVGEPDAIFEVWVNGVLVANLVDVMFVNSTAGRLSPPTNTSNFLAVASGPGVDFLVRDVVVFDELQSDPGVAPPYFAAERLDVGMSVVGAGNTFTLTGPAILSDGSDDTLAEGLNTGDVLELELTATDASEHQHVYLGLTKVTTENNDVGISIDSNGNQDLVSFEPLNTGPFEDNYFPLNASADGNLVFRITNRELTP